MSNIRTDLINADIRQILFATQTAIRSMAPAISHSNKVGYLSDKDGNLISNQLLVAMTALENLILTTKSAQDIFIDWETGLENIECDDEEVSYDIEVEY